MVVNRRAVLALLAAASSWVVPAVGYSMGCQPPAFAARYMFVQDVSPSMKPYMDAMKDGALEGFNTWAFGLFSSVSSSLTYFNDKTGVCWGMQRGFGPTPVNYNSLTNIGTNTARRSVLDALVQSAHVDWDSPLSAGRRVMMVLTDRPPRYPPTTGFAPFDPNDIDCSSHDTPTMAELTSYMNTASTNTLFVVFVVPPNLIASYRAEFAWLGNRLSVVPLSTNKTVLLNKGLFTAMDEIYCGIPPPKTCAEDTALQLLHLQDMSWSYTNDMVHLKSKMDAVMKLIDAQYYWMQVSLGTFVDKAMAPSGYWTDYCYREDYKFSSDTTGFITALNAATIRSGRDWRESQYDAIRDGLQSSSLGWMPGAKWDTPDGPKHLLRVVMVATDAGPHVQGEQPSLPPTDPKGCAYADYPSHEDIKNLLVKYDVYPIFVVTNDLFKYYNWILKNKIKIEGRVVRLGDPAISIVDAIYDALNEMCEANRP